jgi:phosphoribosylamine--glycine ligase
MKVLIIGRGGREHAIAWQVSHSHLCTGLYCAPGNAGISDFAECIDIQETDFPGILSFCQSEKIDLVIIGPEVPLVLGLVDLLNQNGIKAFGPNKGAARLEGSKEFMKDLCKKYNVPTAGYKCFEDIEQAKLYLEDSEFPIVIKADGLAAGKGVEICHSKEEALNALNKMLQEKAFGQAGSRIVIEEFLVGEEVSYFVVADSNIYVPLTSAQDHKRAYDNDLGPNTGGMGAYSPAHMMNNALEKQIQKEIIEPVLNGLKKEGTVFKGILYAGVMLVDDRPYVLEFNVRFGDPECQPILMRLDSDLLEIMNASAEDKLSRIKDDIYWKDKVSLCVVLASNGYPGSYEKGSVIRGLNTVSEMEDVEAFHAGTARNRARK